MPRRYWLQSDEINEIASLALYLSRAVLPTL